MSLIEFLFEVFSDEFVIVPSKSSYINFFPMRRGGGNKKKKMVFRGDSDEESFEP